MCGLRASYDLGSKNRQTNWACKSRLSWVIILKGVPVPPWSATLGCPPPTPPLLLAMPLRAIGPTTSSKWQLDPHLHGCARRIGSETDPSKDGKSRIAFDSISDGRGDVIEHRGLANSKTNERTETSEGCRSLTTKLDAVVTTFDPLSFALTASQGRAGRGANATATSKTICLVLFMWIIYHQSLELDIIGTEVTLESENKCPECFAVVLAILIKSSLNVLQSEIFSPSCSRIYCTG